MKILNLIALFFCFYGFAQEEKLGRTVLPECKEMDKPRACTQQKLQEDIIALITPSLTSTLQTKGITSFVITSALIIDEYGKVIPEQLEVHCDYDVIKNAVVDYYKNLPVFAIAENMHLATEKRALYMAQFYFIYDNAKKLFKFTPRNQAKGFNTYSFPELIGTPVHFKECANSSNPTECTKDKLRSIFLAGFKIPEGTPEGKFKFNILYWISPEGRVVRIEVSDKRFEEETLRVMSKVPQLIPASIHGITYPVSVGLPVTVTNKK